MRNDQLVYIAGSGRSGSTLLDMLLSRHSAVSALGEVHRLYMNLRRDSVAHNCTCGLRVCDCPFWKEVDAALKVSMGGEPCRCLRDLVTTDPGYINIPDDATGLNIEEEVPKNVYKVRLPHVLMVLGSKRFFDLVSTLSPSLRLINRVAHDSHSLYDAVRMATNKPIVVDSTKTPMRLKSLYMERPENFKVIHLIRDGRAVSFARIGRQAVSMTQAAKIWKSEQKKLGAVLFTVPKSKVILVRYESLCTDTENELRKICNFLEIDFEDKMTIFDKTASHALGGNPMRWRREETKIELNESWREEISKAQEREFQNVAGSLNNSFGYIV